MLQHLVFTYFHELDHANEPTRNWAHVLGSNGPDGVFGILVAIFPDAIVIYWRLDD